MKSKILLTFFVFSLFTLVFAQRNFSATITVTGFDAATRAEFNTEWSTDLTNVQSRLSDAFATSFAMTDLIGTSKIKNFEIGFGIVGGVTDKFALSGSTDIPSRGVGVAGAIHFGIDGGVFTKALADFDFIIKIFYLPTIKAGDVKIDAFSFGVKPRWHFYKGGTGNVLSWGGLTLACAI
ncbi:MAG: hypothetical protein OEV44_10620, partial [Spirochaetota bacterium]|nr:hypothetical protein [Spirochaetota bacterium]